MAKKMKIEKNVPLPTRSDIPAFPLDKMEVGDSFEFEITTLSNIPTLRQRLFRHQIANPPTKFSLRSTGDTTMRVFRMEDDEDNQ